MTLNATLSHLGTLEGDFANVLSDFGLHEVPEFEPDRLMKNALTRYWTRWGPKMRGALFFVINSEAARACRSGDVLGRL